MKAISQVMKKKDPFVIVRNGYRALLTITLMAMQQYVFSAVFFSFLQKIGSNNCTSLCSSLFTHKLSKESHRTHTPYADTDALQNLCVDSVFRPGLTNVHAIKETQILHAAL